MKVQHYKVLGFGTEVTDVKPAQFIYGDDTKEEIIGFIHRCNTQSIDVVLFEAQDITSTSAVVLNERLAWESVLDMLTQALRNNPEMFPFWAEEFDLPDIL